MIGRTRIPAAKTARLRRAAIRGRVIAVAGLALLSLGLVAWPWVRHVVSPEPRRVLLVYVREENSLGLEGVPSEDEAARVGLVVAGDAAILPGEIGRIPRGTGILVLRETFMAGLLAESRAVFFKRLPGLVVGRMGGDGGSGPGAARLETGTTRILAGAARIVAGAADRGGHCTLLAADLQVLPAGPGGGGPGSIAISVGIPGGGEAARQATLIPGQEWRLAAVAGENAGVELIDPGDPGAVPALRHAFQDGRPVSVLSVLDLGYWDTDRIEPGRDSEG